MYMCMMSKPTINRQQQGQILAKIDGSAKRINDSSYIVNSQSSNGLCNIRLTELGRNCSCPVNLYRDVKCKHIYAVIFSSALRVQVKKEIIIQPVDSLSCRYRNSSNIMRKAIRRNRYCNIQRYLCKDCGRRFSFNIGFEKMRATPQIITSAMQLYFIGE
jgi:putative transposase